ncbi:lung adenoma susceptibility protein 2 homolog isoform X2 [Columba livia]|uniref:lung adenoma susceptibility protein 2 homolog isoform X2 n=1 Tax=Columba livia TaxID=8932 RepID=UPI0031BAE273
MKTMSSGEESICSPDSTVSSLLRSFSIDSANPRSNSWVHYKDKLYSSASEALEAYIEDFDLSLTSPGISTGKICLCHSTPKQTEFSKRRAKAKRALGDVSQLVGLGSRASPSGRQTEHDPDSTSLATDDLLAFPADGSLPFDLLKSRHPRSAWNSRSLNTSRCPCQTSSLDAKSAFGLQEDGKAVARQNPHKDLSKKKDQVSKPDGYDAVASKGSSRPLSLEDNSFSMRNYPRWLTSQKSALSVSGISSIPDFHYPAWLKSYNLFPDSAQSEGQNVNVQSKASSSQTLETLRKTHSGDQDSSNCFEQKDCWNRRGANKVEGSCNSDPEDQLEFLTLKADKGLEGSTQDVSDTPEDAASPSTTEILGAERSWENAPAASKAPVPVCCEDMGSAPPLPKAEIIHKFLQDCLNDKNKEAVSCGDQHHRPLEALKLMLFKLQAIQGSFSQHETAEQEEELERLSGQAESEFKLCDSEITPLTNSIQKALHHLSRLQSLEDNSKQQEQTSDREDKQQMKE